ncbi:spore coat protein CotH [Paenibacillus sp. DS2015]|uniref:CotH kinase family protein n=1 Tax=Paenibacillus sp. DS2015 TaxID=3373917 RepID=UPI003D225069
MKFRPVATIVVCVCVALVVIGVTTYISSHSESETVSGKASSSVVENTKNITANVFPKDKVIDVKITIDEDDFQSMMDNASAEEVKLASVDYNGMHFDNIGVRTKGNLSLRSVVSMDDSDRYSLKLSFDEYLSQTLYGVSKINLNNGYSDASYMREYLTYELAEQMGLPTPGYSFVNVYVNDELYGFYLAVQQVDQQYLETNFGNSYGALYKGEMTGSGSDLLWIDDKTSSYSGLAMKSESSNDDILIDMIDELNNGTDIEKYLDVEEALGYIALQVVTNNTDSYIGGNKQNYYLYEDDGIFKVLPWDYNMAFGGLGGMMGGGGSEQSSSLLIDEPTQGTLAERPLVARLLEVDEYKEKYHEIIQNATEGYLASATFKERVTQVSDMIASHVKTDPSAFYTYAEYEAGVEKLISINDSQVSNINQQLDGTIASSGDGSGSGGGMGGGGMGGGRTRTANRADATDATAAMAVPDGQAGAGGVAPIGEAGQAGAGGEAPTGEAGQAGAGGEAPTGEAGQAGAGGEAPTGEAGGFDRGQGGFPGGGQGGGQGGFPGGDFGGFGNQANSTPQGTMKDVFITLGALVVLGLSCVFVIFYKRKRL